jgi:outer membrane protein OmpA-like peptidoglycan-associated protein
MGGNSNYQNVIKKLRNNDIRVFPICYGMTDISFMEKLAKDTDGKMFWLSNIKDFSKVFEYIYNLLNNHYKITYKPLNCNDLHNVTLNLDVKEFGFEKIQSFGEYDKSIFTDFAEVGTMTFIDIEFEYNKAEINQESVELLGDLVNQLKRNEQTKIEICGHTDDIGGEDYNMQLSLARANSVKNELVKLGINSARLSVKGFGKTKPIVPNDSEENRKKNRRTEFIIID